MRNYLRYGFVILAIALSNAAFGQDVVDSDTTNLAVDSTEHHGIVKHEGGSLNRGEVYWFLEKPLNTGLPELQFIDTTRSLFHRYDPNMSENKFRTARGNVGLLAQDLEFSYKDNLLFSYGKEAFSVLRYTPFNTKFYQNTVPYVELNYVLGTEKEQNFRMFFAQNVWRGLNVGAEYSMILSPGVYNRTYTRHNNIRVFSNFISKNKHYRAVAGYYMNSLEANENGGITITLDSAERAGYPNKRTVPIKFQEAENIWKENTFYVKQSYHLGVNRVDTIPNSGVNFGYISHAFELSRYRTIYDDRKIRAENYPAIFRDSLRTMDSTFVNVIRNTLSWNIGDVTSYKNAQFLNLSVGAIVDLAGVSTGEVPDTNKLDANEYYKNYNRNFKYFYPFAKVRLNYKNQYFLSGGLMQQTDLEAKRQSSGFSANAAFEYVFNHEKSSDKIFVEVNMSNVLPRPFQEFYIGNNFKWDTTFKTVKTLNLAIGARFKGFTLKGEMTTLDNYIYLTETKFAQTSESFSVFKVTLEKTFRFLRIMAFDTRLVYQHNTSKNVLNLPQFSTRSALYFDFRLLRVTPVQLGIEGYYNTAYTSDFYNPALASFYTQNPLISNYQSGGFIFADVFLNMRIQRANLFFKLSNIGAGLWSNDYAQTHGYPLVQRSFNFGVLWRFYD